MDPQAESLNRIIQEHSPTAYDLLSKRGKEIFFPKKGILSQTAEAKGKRINATIGFAVEDDGTPMRLGVIGDTVNLPPAEVFSYAPGFGVPKLRSKWKEMLTQKNPSLNGKSFSTPMITAALTNGLSILGYLFINGGDKICISNLYWENYDLIFASAYGGSFEFYNLFDGDGFDLASFRKRLTEGPAGIKRLILNFPNNPSGYTPTEQEAGEIVETIRESASAGSRLLVILDDAYFNLVYEPGVERQSLFAYLCDIHENVLAVKVDGPTKEDYVWGFRVGCITYGIKGGSPELYAALEHKTGGAIRGNISNAPNISQSILLKAYESPAYAKEKLVKFNTLKSRYETVRAVLSEHGEYEEYFRAYPFNSGYFMCVRLAEGIDGEAVREVLLREYDTGIINLNNLLRIAFSAVPKGLIPELFGSIYSACKKVCGK